MPPVPHEQDQPPAHFRGKDAIHHVIDAQAQGIIHAAEIHGSEPPGHLSAACDAARETAILLSLISMIFLYLQLPRQETIILLSLISFSWLLWKAGRSAWFGWFRLERLHRVLEQERFEIEHHRGQERDELRVLYAAKGFEGKLLEDVLDVLMADNDRLLKIMVEEELGLSLASQEHPLKQGLGSAIGVFLSSCLCQAPFLLSFPFAFNPVPLGALAVIATSTALLAYFSQNAIIPAIVWNLGIAILALSAPYFLLQLLT